MKIKLNLQQFAEEEGAAASLPAAAETASAAENAANVTISAGDTLPDGSAVSSQVAAAMNKQMERHPELRKVYGQTMKRQGKSVQPQEAADAGAPAAEKSVEERWNEAKKGEFAEFYGRDVQSAIQDRFRNQADANQQLSKLEPMLKVLMDRAEVKNVDELIHHVMDDDSLYEDAASEAGMTVAAYKQFTKMQQELEAQKQREAESIQEQNLRNHFAKLSQQAEELKREYPGFDLMTELKNDRFRRMTSIEGGIPVRDAFFAIHHNELAPQMLAYGMERAKQQMGQTLQAQRRRPAEGAMNSKGQAAAADFNIDPRKLSRQERSKIYDLIHKGKMIWG